MPYTNNKYELIEKYILGELKGKELENFEFEIRNSENLANEIRKQKNLLDSLKYHSSKLLLKSKLEKIHAQIDVNDIKDQLNQEVIFNKKISQKNLLTQLAVAASIALIVTFSTLYIAGFFKFNRHVVDYTQLKNDIRKISSKQNFLWNAFSSLEDKKKPLVPSGTCFEISPNGYFVTNYHVIKGVDSAYITHKNDSDLKYRVKVIYEDVKNDLAILMIDDPKFKPTGIIPYVINRKLSDLGESVYTLGYSKQDVVFSEGSLSSLSGFNEDSTAYQISVPVNPGNSGGPLINGDGELIGMVTGKNYNKDGATYAVKSGYILSIIDSIQADTSFAKPVLQKINYLRGKKRPEQVKAIQPFIFKVEIYQ